MVHSIAAVRALKSSLLATAGGKGGAETPKQAMLCLAGLCYLFGFQLNTVTVVIFIMNFGPSSLNPITPSLRRSLWAIASLAPLTRRRSTSWGQSS